MLSSLYIGPLFADVPQGLSETLTEKIEVCMKRVQTRRDSVDTGGFEKPDTLSI